MADRLKDKVALVTGCGSVGPGWGNGKAMAVLFAREGARVFGIDIDADASLETQRIVEGEGHVTTTVLVVMRKMERRGGPGGWTAPAPPP